MPLFIDDKKFIPAPLVSINKNASFTSDGRPLSAIFNINLQGTILPNRGSPTSYGWFEGQGEPADEGFTTESEKFNALLAKQELIREAFNTPGFKLEYYAEGYEPVKTYPKLISIDFSPDLWVQKTNFSITLEADSLNKETTCEDNDSFVTNASGLGLVQISDEWDIKERDDGQSVYQITRTVSATARAIYGSGNLIQPSGKEPWENAKTWVEARLANASGWDDTRFSLPVTSGANYNFVEQETVNKWAGTYSVSQSFTHAGNNYVEERTVSRNTERPTNDDNAPEVTRIEVQGVISGLDPDNNSDHKLANASGYYDTIRYSLSSIVGANGSGLTDNIEYDVKNGVVSYSQSFINNVNSTYTHTYNVNYNFSSDQLSSIAIQGIISGVTDDGFSQGRFAAATGAWSIIEPTVRNLAMADAISVFNNVDVNSFTNTERSKSIAYDPSLGTINYNYTYGYLLDGDTDNYTDEFTIEFSTDNPQTVSQAGYKTRASINGTIKGLASGEDISSRLTNAQSAWTNTVANSLFTRVNGYSSLIGSNSPGLNFKPVTKTVSVNKVDGSIGYSASFDNRESVPTGVALVDISIDNSWPSDVFASQIIPGRSAGPIFQSIGTRNSASRTINLTMTMHAKSGSYWSYSDVATPRSVANQYLTSGIADLDHRGTGYFVSQDSENWDWKNALYTRSLNVVYNTGMIF